MKVIDMSEAEPAKVSSTNLLRELTNELARARRRLKRAQAKLGGLRALKEDLQPYLQPGDYEHLLERLKREVERRRREELELGGRLHDEHLRQLLGARSLKSIFASVRRLTEECLETSRMMSSSHDQARSDLEFEANGGA